MPRFLSPTFFCVFVVVWTSVFLLVARLFLFSAHQVSSTMRNKGLTTIQSIADTVEYLEGMSKLLTATLGEFSHYYCGLASS